MIFLVYPKDLRRPEIKRIREKNKNVSFVTATRWGRRVRPWIHRLGVAAGVHRLSYTRLSPAVRRLFRGALHITVERFLSALDFAEGKGEGLGSLMLADSRDVFFQGDPFVMAGERLLTGEEAVCFPDPATNGYWYAHFYGWSGCHALGSSPVLCSGLTFGPQPGMREYLQAMAAEIWRHLPRLSPEVYCDQGIHNHVIRKLGCPVQPTPSREGIVATVGMTGNERIRWDKDACEVWVDGKKPAIVHQYDRHSFLAESVRDLFGKN